MMRAPRPERLRSPPARPPPIPRLESGLNKLGGLLLVLNVVLLPRLSIAADMDVTDAVTSDAQGTPLELYPAQSRDLQSMALMRRRITSKTRVRVRTSEGTFVGRVAAVSDSGLVSFTPHDNDFAKVLALGLMGAVAGLPVGVLYGTVFPIWDPLYHAPVRAEDTSERVAP